MLIQAKGKEKSWELPLWAMCSPFPLKNDCDMKHSGNDIQGKYAVPKPEETMFKKEKTDMKQLT